MRTIIILGMHRSATSMVARSLHTAKEVHMGDDLLLNLHDNPEGHYEDKKFLFLNREILQAAGGWWDNPPSRQNILKAGLRFEGRIKKTIQEAVSSARTRGCTSWGFKDPRTALTIDLYVPYLPNPQFIVCYRSPVDVAKSLQKRNGFPIQKGLELTTLYNNRINKFMKRWLKKG